jgi:ATP-dependent RNA helicase RhlE
MTLGKCTRIFSAEPESWLTTGIPSGIYQKCFNCWQLSGKNPVFTSPLDFCRIQWAFFIHPLTKKEETSMSFEAFNLHSTITAGVKALGYTSPTPIQREAIPAVMSGRDVMGLAQTGTGKTAAFGLPILHRLLPGPKGRVRALILGPTRELTEQTHMAFGGMGRSTRLRSAAIYGGVGMQPQLDALRRGVDIVAACPGRLLDHLRRKTIDLSRVEVLVLDEADQMFDMGFLPEIRKIVKQLPRSRQNLLFSATMPPDIKSLADEILRDPLRVQIGRTAPAASVAHTFYPVATRAKDALLRKILDSTTTRAVLVFTRTKRRSKNLARLLEESGYEAAALHGDLSQNNRRKAMEGFRSGQYKILVATDVAARGIDVSGISHVINYDIPDTVDAYTHRIGRTGRASETGDAFTFVCQEDQGLLRAITRLLGNQDKYRMMERFGGPDSIQEPAQARMRVPARRHPAPRSFSAKPRPRGARCGSCSA